VSLSSIPIYLAPEKLELRQGEIVAGLLQSALTGESLVQYLTSGSGNDNKISVAPIEYAVVMTQDCDLEQDFRVRESGGTSDKLLQHILFCEAAPADSFREDPALKSKEIRKQFSNNKMERYQYLGPVDASVDSEGKGIPALGLDFKRYFTIPTELVYLHLQHGAKKRARLAVPFAEHLSDRFFAYHARIALPVQHHIRETNQPG
jgi:hypothetical protein